MFLYWGLISFSAIKDPNRLPPKKDWDINRFFECTVLSTEFWRDWRRHFKFIMDELWKQELDFRFEFKALQSYALPYHISVITYILFLMMRKSSRWKRNKPSVTKWAMKAFPSLSKKARRERKTVASNSVVYWPSLINVIEQRNYNSLLTGTVL